MAETKLKPGFRFHPTDAELVVGFLKRKVMGGKFHDDLIAELDIYKYAPWDLPEKSCLRTGELEWYFFCPREKKYHSGSRFKRSTEIGFWKVTEKDRVVWHNNKTVGKIKSLIFYRGKSPHEERTDWVIHEYMLEDKDLADKGIDQDSYVVCKVYQKEGPGPRNGAQYGRPFNEAEWDNEELGIPYAASTAPVPFLSVTSINEEEWDNEELGIPYVASTAPVPFLSVTSDGSVPNGNHLLASGCIGSASTSYLLGSMPSPGTANPSDPNVLLGNAENIADGDGAPPNDFFEGVEDLIAAGFYSGQNTEFSTNGMATTGGVGTSDESDFQELIRILERISYGRFFLGNFCIVKKK